MKKIFILLSIVITLYADKAVAQQITEGYYLIKSAFPEYAEQRMALGSEVLTTYMSNRQRLKSPEWYIKESIKAKQKEEIAIRYHNTNNYLNISAAIIGRNVNFSKPQAEMIWYIKPQADGTYTLLNAGSMAYLFRLFNQEAHEANIPYPGLTLSNYMPLFSKLSNVFHPRNNTLQRLGFEDMKKEFSKWENRTEKYIIERGLTDRVIEMFNALRTTYNKNLIFHTLLSELQQKNKLYDSKLKISYFDFQNKNSPNIPILSHRATSGQIEAIAGSNGQYSIKWGDFWALADPGNKPTVSTIASPTFSTVEEEDAFLREGYKTYYKYGSFSIDHDYLLLSTTEAPTADSKGAWILTKLDDSQLPNTLNWGQKLLKQSFLLSENMVMGYTTEALERLKTIENVKDFVEEITHLRANKDVLRVKWDENNVFDNQFRILNAGYKYYNGSRRELTVSYFNQKLNDDNDHTFRMQLYHTNEDHTAVSQIFKIKNSNGKLYHMTNPNIKTGLGTSGSIDQHFTYTSKTVNAHGLAADTTITDTVYIRLVEDSPAMVEIEEWDADFFPGLFTIKIPNLPVEQNAFHTVMHPFPYVKKDIPRNITPFSAQNSQQFPGRLTSTIPHSVFRYHPDDPIKISEQIDYMSTWYLEPAKTIDLPIRRLGTSTNPTDYTHIYSSFKYPFAVEIPNGVSTDKQGSNGKRWIYTERKDETSEYRNFVEVKPMKSAVVAKEVPVVIETENFDTIRLNIVKEAAVPNDAVKYVSKVWKGVLEPEVIPQGTYMILNHDRLGQGFFTTTKAGWSAPNRVYLEPGHAVSSAKVIRIESFYDENETTGIDGVKSVIKKKKEVVYYDLQGRRVLHPTKGIYVTSDGQKVVFN